MSNERIYIADDDENIREALKVFLQSEGYEVNTFDTGDALILQFREEGCDLIILDIMMPGSDGFTICSEIRRSSTVPIIMLTARDSDLDYATGLSIGSDDYLTKPFSAMSLVMRVKALFRRIAFEREKLSKGPKVKMLVFGDVTVDEDNKTVAIRGLDVSFTPNEYSLLAFLLKNSSRAVSRDELLDNIWGIHKEVETRAVDDTVRRIRKKLAESNLEIAAVWGFGFRIKVLDKDG
jgi:DNA-binding response OmpR family regulator